MTEAKNARKSSTKASTAERGLETTAKPKRRVKSAKSSTAALTKRSASTVVDAKPVRKTKLKREPEPSELRAWWDSLSPVQQSVVLAAGGVVVVATGGAAAYAIAKFGALVITEAGTTIAIGAAAKNAWKASRHTG
jgi:hypothetical protein